MTANEVKRRGWQTLDFILVTGDAYVDHPSFGAAVIGRTLEEAGYRIGIIAQPETGEKKRIFLSLEDRSLDFLLPPGILTP